LATEKQIAANRRNAAKSTGPRSPEGKARSSMNALKSGVDAEAEIIPGENPAALAELTNQYLQRWRPTTPEQRCYVDTLIRNDWVLSRLARAESDLWQYGMLSPYQSDKNHPEGAAMYRCERAFGRLQSRINFIQRSFKEALRELKSLQSGEDCSAIEDVALEATPEPPPQLVEELTSSPEIGFVPSLPEEPAGVTSAVLAEVLHSLSPAGDPACHINHPDQQAPWSPEVSQQELDELRSGLAFAAE
jgi:hypothetical protein